MIDFFRNQKVAGAVLLIAVTLLVCNYPDEKVS